MTTTLPKTTPDKQAARTQRYYAKKVQTTVAIAATTYGGEATVEAVLATLAEVGMNISQYRRSQAANSAHCSLVCLLREQQWAAEPGNLLVRYDEVLPGDQIVEFAYNIKSSDRLRAIVTNEVAETGHDDVRIRFVGQDHFYFPRKTTSLVSVHRPKV
jgi:hypothetical protein